MLFIIVKCVVLIVFILKKAIFGNTDKTFWETDPVKTWDDINNVGLR